MKLVTVMRTPRVPARLGPEARAFWRAVAKPLTELGVMDPRLDKPLLELTCSAYGLWRRAIREAAEATPENARLYREVVGEWADELIKCMREFGLTPAARDELRRRLEDPQARAQDEFIALLRKAKNDRS